jgi:menaquinone-dependent protoporphyrinogen oxidase
MHEGPNMSKPLLVAYATKHESTHEVAEAIAVRLRERGLEAEVRSARGVETLAPYDGVVIGGALYMGRWHSDARRFLSHHRDELTVLPLSVFAMGPLTGQDEDVAESRKQLDHALAKEPRLEPVTVAIFGGVLDPAKQHFPFTHMEASDARDWEEIRSWADTVASLSMPAAV